MKAEKVIGIAACAFACVTSSAFANTTNGWFSVTADTAIRASNCETETNGAAVTVESSKIVLDNDKDTPLIITPSVALNATNSTDIAKIAVTALLTPSNTNDFEVTSGAKAGFAVGVFDNMTNFYGYTSGGWVKLNGTVADGVDTSFAIILNYRDHNVQFLVNDAVLAAAEGGATSFSIDNAATKLNGLDAFGSGSITLVNAGYEVAVAAYGGKKYGSIADAVEVAGANKASVLPVSESGETPTGSTTAANDLPKIVCAVLNLDPADGTAQAKAVPVVNDADPDNVTLQVPVTEEGVVEFEVRNDGVLVDTFDASAIKIPVDTGVYTVTPVLK